MCYERHESVQGSRRVSSWAAYDGYKRQDIGGGIKLQQDIQRDGLPRQALDVDPRQPTAAALAVVALPDLHLAGLAGEACAALC